MDDAYRAAEIKRVKKLYNRKKHGADGDFVSSEALADWWISKFNDQNGRCFYCDTGIDVIGKLIDAGKLHTRSVRGNGARGRHLELDRMNPHLGYVRDNCALSCYYCNNDKSYTYNAEEYKTFFGHARNKHFRHLGEGLEKLQNADPKAFVDSQANSSRAVSAFQVTKEE